MPHPFAVLRVRNFRLYFVGQIVSNVGTWFQSLAQALLATELTGSAQTLGLVTALQFAPVLLLAPYAGTLADRLRPRSLLMTTASLAALLACTLAFVAWTGGISVPWLCAIALALGSLQAFDRPMAQAFLFELVGPDQLPKAVGLHSITQSSGRMLGPALAGVVYALLGATACFAINAASFLVVVLALGLMRSDQLWSRRSAASESGLQLRDGVRYVLRHPELRAPLLANVLIGCFAFNFMTTITAAVRFELGGDAGAVGAAHALNAAGAVGGGLLVASLRRPPARGSLALACCALGAAIAVNALAPSLHAFLLWAPFFGLTVGAYHTSLQTYVQRTTDPALLGRVSGLLVLGSAGATPIASLLGGWLIDAWSPRAAMGLGAVACLAGGIALAASQRAWRYSSTL